MKAYTCKDFSRYIWEVNKGRKKWNYYKKRYNIRNTNSYLVLLSSNNDEYNLIFLRYIEKCFEPHKRIIILTIDEKMAKIAPLFEKKNELIVERISLKVCKEIIAYYAFMPFYERFYLISLEEPYERKCDYLIGKKGITAEELIVTGIMGFDSEKYQKLKKKPSVPNYKGNDVEIQSFFCKSQIEESI